MPAKPPGAQGQSRHRRALLPGLLLLLLVLLAGHGALWLWAVGRLETGFLDWAAARRAEGWSVAHGPPARTGWPRRAALRLPALDVATADGTGWQAETPILLAWSPPAMEEVRLALAGRHRVRLGGAEAVSVRAERLDLRLPLRHAGGTLPPWAQAEAAGLVLDPGGAAIGQASLALDTGPGAGPDGAVLALRLLARAVDLPADGAGSMRAALGPRIAELALQASATGRPLPMAAPEARAWRDGGGAMRLHEAALRWGPLATSLEGRMTLDPSLQPAAEGRIRLAGGATLLDTLAGAGLLSPRAASLARAALPLLEQAPPQGEGPPEIVAPIRLDRGVVSLAGLPLLRLPGLAWPPR